jgi:hypothetical protein
MASIRCRSAQAAVPGRSITRENGKRKHRQFSEKSSAEVFFAENCAISLTHASTSKPLDREKNL